MRICGGLQRYPGSERTMMPSQENSGPLSSSRLLAKGVKRKLDFDDGGDSSDTEADNSLQAKLKKRLEINFTKYLKNFPLSSKSNALGWEVLLYFDVQRLLDVFPENQREEVHNIYKNIVAIIKRYYVKRQEFIKQVADEENIALSDFYTTTNPRIVDIRRTYDLVESEEMENDTLLLKASLDEISTLYSDFSTLISLCLTAKSEPKSSYIADKMRKAMHVACFRPFRGEFKTDFFYDIKITPHPKVANYFENNMTDDGEYFDIKKESYFTLDGNLVVLCEKGDSRGLNSSGKAFEVINLVSPSEEILRENFNKLIRDKYPDMFKNLSPMTFFNVIQSRQEVKISCLNHRKMPKNHVLAAVNLSKIVLVDYKGTYVPQVQMYVNCLFEAN